MEIEGRYTRRIVGDFAEVDPKDACRSFLARYPGTKIVSVNGEPIVGLCCECGRPLFDPDDHTVIAEGKVCIYCAPEEDARATKDWDELEPLPEDFDIEDDR